MSVTLAIDTAGPRLQLGLRGEIVADTESLDMAKGHAEAILPRIAALLARNGLTHADLGRVAATSGPGSFTGLRIGLAAARGLALGLGVPALGIPTLLAISLSGPREGPFTVLLDARREEAYRQRFAAPGVPADDPLLVPTAQARAMLDPGETVIETPFCDIAALAGFAATADPGAYRPDPLYLRGADAKPQDRARIARQGPAR